VGRVGGEEAVQCGGAGAGQPGDEDGPGDRDVRVLGVLLPRGLRQQACDERAAQEHPRHLAAERGEPFVARIRLEQDVEGLPVVVGSEVAQPGQAGRGFV